MNVDIEVNRDYYKVIFISRRNTECVTMETDRKCFFCDLMRSCYLNEIVFSALSATALALSISDVSRWKAMYRSQIKELSGDCNTNRSKSSAVSGLISPSS